MKSYMQKHKVTSFYVVVLAISGLLLMVQSNLLWATKYSLSLPQLAPTISVLILCFFINEGTHLVQLAEEVEKNYGEPHLEQLAEAVRFDRSVCVQCLEGVGKRRLMVLHRNIKPFLQLLHTLQNFPQGIAFEAGHGPLLPFAPPQRGAWEALCDAAADQSGNESTTPRPGLLLSFGLFGYDAGQDLHKSASQALSELADMTKTSIPLKFLRGISLPTGYIFNDYWVSRSTLVFLNQHENDPEYAQAWRNSSSVSQLLALHDRCRGLLSKAWRLNFKLKRCMDELPQLHLKASECISTCGAEYAAFSAEARACMEEYCSAVGAALFAIRQPLLVVEDPLGP